MRGLRISRWKNWNKARRRRKNSLNNKRQTMNTFLKSIDMIIFIFLSLLLIKHHDTTICYNILSTFSFDSPLNSAAFALSRSSLSLPLALLSCL